MTSLQWVENESDDTDELIRVASEPARNRPVVAMNKTSNDSNQQQIESSQKRTNNLHRALEIFQRLKSIDRQERTLREERVKLQDELGAILIRQNK